MIGWLQGKIIDRENIGKLVLDVNGVGYDVETSLTTFFALETDIKLAALYIHTVVREDAFLLYGFLEKEERTLFRSLIKVNGIGPKLAMSILSSITPREFITCVINQDVTRLVQLPGIGKKTAERLLVEMKDSILGIAPIELDLEGKHPSHQEQHEAISALESLGYKRQEATNAVMKLSYDQATCEQLIREALRLLAR